MDKKAIGGELDFLALDKQGNLLLIEYKHGSNTSGIYLSPLQIGLYYDLFNQLPRDELKESVSKMLEQKKKIGLINAEWKRPNIKDIVPVLIVSEYSERSLAKTKYQEIMDIARDKKGNSFLENIKTYNYTIQHGLTPW
ncbi:amidase family protein [Thiorhodovibrio frisius]|uniref:amidase family protein n=1 Tax=Thiorhodovibrio frisius TaxID=631362 RepID=UPI00167F3662|nr:amidase family protein [Thiorhodovibrio frisius]